MQRVKAEHPSVPITLYANGSGGLLERLGSTGVDVVGLDWTIDMGDARKRLGPDQSVQVCHRRPSVSQTHPFRPPRADRVSDSDCQSQYPAHGHKFTEELGDMILQKAHLCPSALTNGAVLIGVPPEGDVV